MEVDDGDVAVEYLRQNPRVDVILIDNQMPRMTGAEAVQAMRSDLNYNGIIIGVTGNALESDILDFIARGADDVIVKPLTSKKFSQCMEKYTTRLSDTKGQQKNVSDAVNG